MQQPHGTMYAKQTQISNKNGENHAWMENNLRKEDVLNVNAIGNEQCVRFFIVLF